MSQPVVSQAIWREFLAGHRSEVLDATVTAVLPFGALVTVGPGIPGLLPRSSWRGDARAGDTVAVRIVEVDDHVRRLSFTAA
jgi:ribosomal protein S1